MGGEAKLAFSLNNLLGRNVIMTYQERRGYGYYVDQESGPGRTERDGVVGVDIHRQEQVELKAGQSAANQRLEDLNVHLVEQSRRIDALSGRIDRLFEVIVRREEHEQLSTRVQRLEQDVADLKKQVAA